MTETLIALVFAHVLADFVFQTNWMVANKRNPVALVAHIGVVLLMAIACIGALHPALFALAAAHMALDAAKTWGPWKGLGAFLADQALHGATLVLVALWVPDLWAQGLWGAVPEDGGWVASLWSGDGATPILPALFAALTGLILTTRAGGFGIGMYMEPWAAASPAGLPGGGRAIGNLERGLIFLLVMSGMPEGIGFLIAAKSVLRFGAVGDDRAISEYVIIGTLASFGWAIATSFATLWVLQYLSPLGIPDLSP
jgi:Protein of unknown function (DUF3307)